jgi:hypothetical protein
MTRHPTRRRLALLAAASLLLAACHDDTSGATSEPSPTNPQSSAPSASPPTEPDGHRAWQLLKDQPEDIDLPAGAYGLTANGVSDHVVVVRAPDGYQHLGGWTFGAGPPFRAMGFLTADVVPPDPCGSEARSKFDHEVDPGPRVVDLADALVAQKGAVTSGPRPVTVGGYHGLYLTYQVGKGIDVRHCEAQAFDIFATGPGAWYLEVARERAAIWILDVDGERLVLAWVAVPGVSSAHMREMTRMVRSARLVLQ